MPNDSHFPPVLPNDWRQLLQEELRHESFSSLWATLKKERATHAVFPNVHDVYQAFQLCPLDRVSVVLLGQDPYASEGQAHGLSFSVPEGVQIPPSLRNIFQELEADLGISPPNHGQLDAWARQGVLLLNSMLTVRAQTPLSHQGLGWERFTDAVLAKLSATKKHVVFVLWGQHAQRKAALLADRHTIVQSAHPSPLSAYRGFWGSRPFSRANAALLQHGQPPIDWKLPP